MKKYLLVSLLPFLFRGDVIAQSVKGFQIKGLIGGLKDGEKVVLGNYFVEFSGKVPYTRVDSCTVNNQKFQLSGSVLNGPRFYTIIFPEHRSLSGNKEITLFVDNGDDIILRGMNIESSTFESDVKISGSPSDYSYNCLKSVDQIIYNIAGMIQRQLSKVRDSVGFDRSLVEGLIESKNIINQEIYIQLAEHGLPNWQVSLPWALVDLHDVINHSAIIMDCYKLLDDKIKESYYGKKLKELAKLSVGQPFPLFSLPDTDGKLIALEDILDKGKITIVHFWGSNSFEREKFQTELRNVYKKYHDKGLNVIAVSADSIATEWKVRVQVEQYPWVNVSDLKGNLKGGIVQDVYMEGGHAVPNTTNVLLDDKGRILAWDANGVELQWYLWKYFGE